jgi:hypothetical protein
MAQTEEKRAFAQRLREALAAQGVALSPTKVAHGFNLRHWGGSITPHTARHWLMGSALPTQDKLRTLADWLQVSPEELRFGRALVPQVVGGDALLASLNLVDREMLARYLALPPVARRTVCDVVAAFTVATAARETPPR